VLSILKRRWRLISAAAVAIALLLFHAPILRGLVGFLIVDQADGDCGYVCLRAWGGGPEGDRAFDEAAKLRRGEHPCQVLLLAPRSDRISEIGVLPSYEAICRRELEKRRVPQEAVSVIPGGGYNDWDAARSLAAWLNKHPEDSVILLTSRFRSALVRRGLDDALDPSQAARVHVRALPDRRFSETDWWKHRAGFLEVGFCGLMRIQNWCAPGDKEPPPRADADEYERDFLRSLEDKAAVEH
jgi:hypothetical protein